LASAWRSLGSLTCIVDRNELCIDGPTEDVMAVEPLGERFASFGWQVQRIDGHDLRAITDALDQIEPVRSGPPRVLIADTVKGKGVGRMERDLGWHVGNLGPDDYDAVVAELRDRHPAAMAGSKA
jgi:transketolase